MILKYRNPSMNILKQGDTVYRFKDDKVFIIKSFGKYSFLSEDSIEIVSDMNQVFTDCILIRKVDIDI